MPSADDILDFVTSRCNCRLRSWPQPEREPAIPIPICQHRHAPPIAQLSPPLAPQARTLSRASRDGDSSGDFEAPEDAEDLDRSSLVDDVRAALAPNAETGGAAAFEARRRDGLWGYAGRCLRVDECRSALVCSVSLFRVRGTGKSQSHAIVLSVCVCAFSSTIFGHKEVSSTVYRAARLPRLPTSTTRNPSTGRRPSTGRLPPSTVYFESTVYHVYHRLPGRR